MAPKTDKMISFIPLEIGGVVVGSVVGAGVGLGVVVGLAVGVGVGVGEEVGWVVVEDVVCCWVVWISIETLSSRVRVPVNVAFDV
jgi:hypothetical protein